MMNFFLTKQQVTCESTSGSSRWDWLSSALRSLYRTVQKSPLFRELVHVSQAGVTTLHALTRATSNTRLYVGVWMIAVVAPLAGVSYQFVQRSAVPEGDFYNAYYYLFAISPHVSLLITFTGVFFLFKQFDKRKFFLVIPAVYHVSKIIWLSMATSNEDFHRILPVDIVLLGLTSTLVWFFTADYLMGLQFHKFDGLLLRLKGVIDSPLDDKTKLTLTHTIVDAIQEFKTK